MSVFKDFSDNPIDQFKLWYDFAKDHYENANSPTPFDSSTLCTSNKNNQPTGRIVLIKEILSEGIVFYTNYSSRKAIELEVNPLASIVVHWGLLGRQARIDGKIEKVSREHSKKYFKTRPRLSQIGAHASEQSSQIAGRVELVQKIDELEKKYKDLEVPCPRNWGGYILRPKLIEFWVNGEFRLHDRLEYRLDGDQWKQHLLSP